MTTTDNNKATPGPGNNKRIIPTKNIVNTKTYGSNADDRYGEHDVCVLFVDVCFIYDKSAMGRDF